MEYGEGHEEGRVTQCLRNKTEIGAGSTLGAHVEKADGWNQVFTSIELACWLHPGFGSEIWTQIAERAPRR
jgi:hypothetical protein